MTDVPRSPDEVLAGRDDVPSVDDDGPTFDAPWQARAFGLAVALCEQTGRDWASFQGRLVDHRDDVDPAELDAAVEDVYYRAWLAALEDLLVEEGLLARTELGRRQAEFSAGERDASEFVAGDVDH